MRRRTFSECCQFLGKPIAHPVHLLRSPDHSIDPRQHVRRNARVFRFWILFVIAQVRFDCGVIVMTRLVTAAASSAVSVPSFIDAC